MPGLLQVPKQNTARPAVTPAVAARPGVSAAVPAQPIRPVTGRPTAMPAQSSFGQQMAKQRPNPFLPKR